jgi:predicted aldo/keto reductase-like oxidoreductase
VPYCPKGLDIPKIISTYNNNIFDNREFKLNKEEALDASRCIGCKACEKKCPQSIEISSVMKNFTEKAGMKYK